MQPVFLSRSANQRQATDDLLKNWFRTTNGGQEYIIFVIIERLQLPESDDDSSYDPLQHESLKSKDNSKTGLAIKEEERTKVVIKKEGDMEPGIKEEERTKPDIKKRKDRRQKQPIIKTERAESSV